MILQEYIGIKISSKNLQYYKNLGYKVKNKETVLVKNEDIPRGSHIKEKRTCDNCGKEIYRTRRAISDTFDSYGKDLCIECSKIFRIEKMKKTNIEKYGTEFPMQSEEIKKKAKKTTSKHFGCEYSFQNKEINQKAKLSFQEKYGQKGVLNVNVFKEKIRQTNLEKYGCENVFSNKDIQKKIKNTMLEKYGVENVSEVKEIKEKRKETLLKRYGVDHPMKVEEFKEKAKSTFIDHYGVDSPLKSDVIREKIMKTVTKNGTVSTSSQQLELFNICKDIFPNFIVTLNKPVSLLCLDIEIITEKGIKIDLEYDGSYWHKDYQKDRKRDEVLKTFGYKIIRVKSKRKLPTINQIKEAVNYVLEDEKHTYSQIVLSDY